MSETGQVAIITGGSSGLRRRVIDYVFRDFNLLPGCVAVRDGLGRWGRGRGESTA